MRHIKNFIHNINDIVLALIIVVIAAGIIFWRMQIILDYPKTVVSEQVVTEETVDAPDAEASDGDASAAAGSDGADAEAGDTEEGE